MVVLLVATACSADPQVWSGPVLPGVSGSLPESMPRGIDRRVVNGVAWVSSSSASDGSWLQHRIDVLEVQDLSGCLQGAGLSPDLLLAAAKLRERAARRTVTPQFPDPGAVQSLGLWPEQARDPEKQWSSSEILTVQRCRRRNQEKPSALARQANATLRQAFEELVSGRPDPVLADANEQFARCMAGRGYPASEVTNPQTFVVWAAAHRSTDDPAGRRTGADYLTCGAPVWRSAERSRASVRLAFINAHESDLRALSDLVGGT